VEQSSKTNNILTVMYTITKWLGSETSRFELVVFLSVLTQPSGLPDLIRILSNDL